MYLNYVCVTIIISCAIFQTFVSKYDISILIASIHLAFIIQSNSVKRKDSNGLYICIQITITSLLTVNIPRSFLIDPVGIYKMSYFSDKIDSLLRGTRKTEDKVSEIKMHVEQLEARFEERINQLFTMVERNNEILKKLVVVENKERSEFVGNQLEVTVLPACLISRPHIKDMHGDSNTPLNRFKYFLISCLGDSINPDQLSKVVLTDLLYQVHEKDSEYNVKTWTQIPLKYKLAAYDDLQYLGIVYRIPINRSRDNWLENDSISYYFRNKKPDQLVNSHLTSSVYSNANLLVFQSSKFKAAKGSNPGKGTQPVEGLRAVVSGGNVPPHLSTIDLDDDELDSDVAEIISNSTVMQQGQKRPLDDAEIEGSNKMSTWLYTSCYDSRLFKPIAPTIQLNSLNFLTNRF
ncbi:hypothetical protein EDC96DRAFT_548975 [Choanephora cucurbitarum]|nr:hypothetical protein EDC96DRAFT_548975 [Choanephora cucurbitarum]